MVKSVVGLFALVLMSGTAGATNPCDTSATRLFPASRAVGEQQFTCYGQGVRRKTALGMTVDVYHVARYNDAQGAPAIIEMKIVSSLPFGRKLTDQAMTEAFLGAIENSAHNREAVTALVNAIVVPDRPRPIVPFNSRVQFVFGEEALVVRTAPAGTQTFTEKATYEDARFRADFLRIWTGNSIHVDEHFAQMRQQIN